MSIFGIRKRKRSSIRAFALLQSVTGFVHNVLTDNLPYSSIHDHGLITSIAFHPLSNAIAYIDNKGQLTRWSSPIPDGLAPPVDPIRAQETSNGTSSRRRSDSASTSTSSRPGGGGDLFRRDVDEDEFDRANGDGLDDWIDDDTNEFGMNENEKDREERYRMPSIFADDHGGGFASKGKRKADRTSIALLVVSVTDHFRSRQPTLPQV